MSTESFSGRADGDFHMRIKGEDVAEVPLARVRDYIKLWGHKQAVGAEIKALLLREQALTRWLFDLSQAMTVAEKELLSNSGDLIPRESSVNLTGE